MDGLSRPHHRRQCRVAAFLQRYIGYCCTGLTTEHTFVFAYGTGANGKCTFINTLANIFGDYATVADMGTFIATKAERHPTDLAKLRGARLVVAQETQRGRRWDETKIKALTGGDRMTARFMRQDFFDFVPTFKLFIAGNHKPRLTASTRPCGGACCSCRLPCRSPPAERDPSYEKLRAEWPAILRWCIDGCLEWQRIGLAPPAIVRDATEAYFADQDTLEQWLDDCTEDAAQAAFTRISDVVLVLEAMVRRTQPEAGQPTSVRNAGGPGLQEGWEGGTGQRGFCGIAIKPR